MKSSHVILIAVGVLILAAAAYSLIGQADAPTTLTDADGLMVQQLLEEPGAPGVPGGLRVLSMPGDPRGDAAAFYERAISLYAQQRGALPKTREHDELVAGLCGLLAEAADAGHVEAGFMDRHIPVEIGAEPDFQDAVEAIYELAINQVAYRYTHGDPEGARELALAVWVFGRRMFEGNVRLYNRVIGLDMMESAGSMLYEMSADNPGTPGVTAAPGDTEGTISPGADGEALRAWSQAINQIRRHWQPKLEVVMGIEPPIGDLVNIALNDGDRMFRIEATLRLGIHKHGPVGRGNRRAIQNAIRLAMESDDPVLAEAGRAAEALTQEEKRRLY